jgi:hypothetical protein
MINPDIETGRRRGRPRKKLEDKLSNVLTTDKQKSFLRNRMVGMNKKQAAIQAGYAPATASIMAKKITDKLSCNRIFLEEAHRQGLTVEAIISELKRGVTESMHPQHPDQPDNFNRRAYADMALRLYNAYPPAIVDIEQKETVIEISEDLIRRMERF